MTLVADVNNSADLKNALLQGFSVQLPAGVFTFGDTLELNRDGQFLRGAGPKDTFLVYTGTGTALRTAATGFKIGLGFQDFSLEGNSAAKIGIEVNGCRMGLFQNLVISNFPASPGVGLYVKGKYGAGVYYNTFSRITSGGATTGTKNVRTGMRFETTDFFEPTPAGLARVNNNLVTMCSAQFNTDFGLQAIATVSLQLIACNFEDNSSGGTGTGAQFQRCVSTFVDGGHFEQHPTGDIDLSDSTVGTFLIRPHLGSTSQLIGSARGSSGDVYLISRGSGVPGPTNYTNNWMQKSYISEINAGSVDFTKFSSVTPIVYARSSSSSAYQFRILNDGQHEWGGGASAVDTILYRFSANTLSVGADDDFRVNGAFDNGRLRLGNYYLWVDSSKRLRIKDGAPSTDTDPASVVIVSVP